MDRLLVIICVLFTAQLSFGQSFYEVKKVGRNYSLEQIHAAFSTANFCGSFFEAKRNTLVFIDGSEIELKSKKELIASGINDFKSTCFLNDTEVYYDAVWSINESGYILKGFQTEKHGSRKEYIHLNN